MIVSKVYDFTERAEKNLTHSSYKNILVEHHPHFHEFLIAQETIKKYIQQKGLILYGGTAIDYALRLRGDKIYEDDDLPDFDFWSPIHMDTAQELVNILVDLLPGVNVYGTRAKYIRTFRISVGFNNWVADITYIPRELYDKLPTLIFDGMRIIHPHFQFADLNSSLTFPYDGAPYEVVFGRWKKDIERFNKLFIAYPIIADHSAQPLPALTQVAIPHEIISHSILQGFAAYSLYYNTLAEVLKSRSETININIPCIPGPLIYGNDILLNVPFKCVDIVAHRDVFTRHSDVKLINRFYPLLDLMEASMKITLNDCIIIAYTTFGRMINYHSFQLDSQSYRIRAVSIHGLAKYFIACYLRAKYFAHTIQGPIIESTIYRDYYIACLDLIKLSRGTSVEQIFDPTLTVFGETNIPLSDMIMHFQNITTIIEDESIKLNIPKKNIRPLAKDVKSPPFDYNSCPFLKISGEEKI